MTRDDALVEIGKMRAALGVLETYIQAVPLPSPPPEPLTPSVLAHGLSDPVKFFDHLRAHPPLGPSLSAEEVTGCERIMGACAAASFPAAWAAYVLATAVHETAGRLAPIAEYGKGHGRPYGSPGRNRGQVAYGRGDVQLTWDDNYERADRELALGGALIANYELALDPAISARILVSGMEHGWFTGKRLADYIPEPAELGHFTAARRIVNGVDKAALIAGYAVTFQAGLRAGGWT